jgi:hypothetical protein
MENKSVNVSYIKFQQAFFLRFVGYMAKSFDGLKENESIWLKI